MLEENRRIDIIPGTSLKLIQDRTRFCYGIDAILLSSFVRPKKDDIVLDLGTGTGIIAFRIFGRYRPKKVYGIEIQKEMADMAKESLALNKLEEDMEIVNMDLNKLSDRFKRNSVDLVVSNPPYMKKDSGIINSDESISISRHEIRCDIDDIAREASMVLKEGSGRLSIIHRPNRLVDIFEAGRKYSLEPKRLVFIHPKASKAPNLVMVEMVKYGKKDLLIEDPIYVYDQDNKYTEDIHKIYDRKGEGDDKW